MMKSGAYHSLQTTPQQNPDHPSQNNKLKDMEDGLMGFFKKTYSTVKKKLALDDQEGLEQEDTLEIRGFNMDSKLDTLHN
jgi:hypothetical protein